MYAFVENDKRAMRLMFRMSLGLVQPLLME
jgi:hypothetical protein